MFVWAQAEADLAAKYALELELREQLDEAETEKQGLQQEIAEAKALHEAEAARRAAVEVELAAQRAAEAALRGEMEREAGERRAAAEEAERVQKELQATLAAQIAAQEAVLARLAAADKVRMRCVCVSEGSSVSVVGCVCVSQERAELAVATEKKRLEFERSAKGTRVNGVCAFVPLSTPRDVVASAPTPSPAGWKSAERLKVLRAQMREALPLIAEANALAKALGKPVHFSLRLLPVRGLFCMPPITEEHSSYWTEEVSTEELRERYNREVRFVPVRLYCPLLCCQWLFERGDATIVSRV